MPVFALTLRERRRGSLPLSLTTGFLAPALIVAGTFSEARGRVPLMLSSLLAAALLTIACAFAPRWGVLLALRALAGISFAGLPAISMAYLSEEVHPNSIGLAMGLAISGNGLGGMSGRLLTALVADLLSWRWALAVIGALGVAATLVAWRTLPPSRHFKPHPLRIGALSFTFWEQLRDTRLVPLYCEGFCSAVPSCDVQLHHLSPSRRAVLPESRRRGIHLRRLPGRDRRVGLDRIDRRSSGPAIGAGVDGRRDARRHRAHGAASAPAGDRRRRRRHVRIFRRTLGGEQLGRVARDAREGPSSGAVSVLLLSSDRASSDRRADCFGIAGDGREWRGSSRRCR